MGRPADPDTDAVLDVVALVEARLRRDEPAFTFLLDQGDNRGQAYLLAGICAHLIARSPDLELASLLAEIRAVATESG